MANGAAEIAPRSNQLLAGYESRISHDDGSVTLIKPYTYYTDPEGKKKSVYFNAEEVILADKTIPGVKEVRMKEGFGLRQPIYYTTSQAVLCYVTFGMKALDYTYLLNRNGYKSMTEEIAIITAQGKVLPSLSMGKAIGSITCGR